MNSDPESLIRQRGELFAELAGLSSLAGMRLLAADIRQRLLALLPVDGLEATALISALNDRLTAKIIELSVAQHRLPPTGWCWLAFGSEGRGEQTLCTDQDNGLIFNASSETEGDALRELFLPFAQSINVALADAGFSLCSGGIMAGNPACCLSLHEWRGCFIDWVRRPDPAALLNASIFFDLRPLYGDHSLAESLRQQMLALTQDTPAFLHLMSANALQVDVPLNFRGEIAVGDGDMLDLKKYGTRLFVDAARILALASGSEAVDTIGRLQQAGPLTGLATVEVAAMEAAFRQLLRLRIGHQLGMSGRGSEEVQSLRPAVLNDMDRAILREALKQARRLQYRLKLNYSL